MRTAAASVIGSNGLAITPSAPSETKCSSSRGCARAVMNTTGMSAVFGLCRRCVSVVGPSIIGIMTSSRIRSGDQAAAAASASPPELHERTVKSGSRLERKLDDLPDVGLVIDMQHADRGHATSLMD